MVGREPWDAIFDDWLKRRIIRQIYYPFRQWQEHVSKPVTTFFFQKTANDEYHIWNFGFEDEMIMTAYGF